MRILYSAIDQVVPAAHGGSVHVTAVADGLARLGHDVQVLVTPGDSGALPAGGTVRWSALPPPLGDRRLRLLRSQQVYERARAFRPDVVIERYYNFGGEGVLAASRIGALAVLEVNAPVVDYPGSWKRVVDRAMVLEPMRRWREWQIRKADLIVTPSVRILPADVPASKILKTEWGADTSLFRPGAGGSVPFRRTANEIVAVFTGAFRAWHGAIHIVDAIRRLHARGHTGIRAVLVGEGPELARVRGAAANVAGITLVGAVPHSHVPAILAASDIGLAPFDVSAHPTLAHEFHWSPLKIFEYMSAGLPVVAPRIDRLAEIVTHLQEGVLYDAADSEALPDALARLTNPVLRAQLGAAARERAVRQFSWESHCRQLDEAIRARRSACGS